VTDAWGASCNKGSSKRKLNQAVSDALTIPVGSLRREGESHHGVEDSSGLRRQQLKGLILAQNERWRRGLGMQVEREIPQGMESGVRERNTWFICPQAQDSCGKLQVILDNISGSKV
jgi:hypothetical protein